MDWMSLMQGVTQAIHQNESTPHSPGHDPDNLVGGIEQMIGQHFANGEQSTSPDGMNGLFEQVQGAIHNAPSTPQRPGEDPGNLMGSIGGLFNQFSQQQSGPQAMPASEDQYGDPEDSQGGADARGIEPGSQDPYGDPQDTQQSSDWRGIRPGSQDSYGDPQDTQESSDSSGISPGSQDPDGDPADQRF